MKCISIWQPWASLIVHGYKFFETRTWPAPASVIGKRIGIASTKTITPDQRSAASTDDFVRWFDASGLPPLEELPRGYLLGTVLLHSVERVTEEFLDDITDEEKAFGWYQIDGYAWRLRHPQMLPHPIPIQGKQGLYDFKGFENDHPQREGEGRKEQAPALRLASLSE